MSEKKEKEYESHKPTDFSFYAILVVFIVNAIIVFNVPLNNEVSWWGKVFIAGITFFAGGLIYCGAMESVSTILKVVVEAAWAIFLLPVTVGLLLAYDEWDGLVQLAIDLGADKKAAPLVAAIGCALVLFVYSLAVWAVMYPLSMVAGTDPRKEYRVSKFFD